MYVTKLVEKMEDRFGKKQKSGIVEIVRIYEKGSGGRCDAKGYPTSAHRVVMGWFDGRRYTDIKDLQPKLHEQLTDIEIKQVSDFLEIKVAERAEQKNRQIISGADKQLTEITAAVKAVSTMPEKEAKATLLEVTRLMTALKRKIEPKKS